jgi:hypothetical protein
MSRNMQLAHQAKTKKKITKESLFAKFNFNPTADDEFAASCSTGGSGCMKLNLANRLSLVIFFADDPSTASKLSQKARQPRKASKKALDEMRQETQGFPW